MDIYTFYKGMAHWQNSDHYMIWIMRLENMAREFALDHIVKGSDLIKLILQELILQVMKTMQAFKKLIINISWEQ